MDTELINDSLENFSKLKTSADFCHDCGDLLTLPMVSDYIECTKCGFKMSLLDYPMNEIVTKKVFTEKKIWLERYLDKVQKGDYIEDFSKKDGDTRPIIDQDCAKCDSKKMYYSTMQTRSADEGATVFYECVKCGHTEKVNNQDIGNGVL